MKYLVFLMLVSGCIYKGDIDLSQFNEYQDACLNLKHEIKHATFKVSIDQELKCIVNFKYKTFEYTAYIMLQDVESHKTIGEYSYLSENAEEFANHYNTCLHLSSLDRYVCVNSKRQEILNRKYGAK